MGPLSLGFSESADVAMVRYQMQLWTLDRGGG